VGVTNKYSVVLFGDDISAPATEGSRANTIVGGAALGQRKTLFQDIFGASAFADLSHVPPHVDSNSVVPPSALPRSDNDVPVLLDSPAYLMPPIGSLYEPIMESFLKPRSQEDDIHLVEGIEQDEDVEMAEQSDDEPVTVRGRQERLVDQKEMDLFVKLFQQTKGVAFRFDVQSDDGELIYYCQSLQNRPIPLMLHHPKSMAYTIPLQPIRK
jgi:NET1-associated nuclear protein 1 (U3 small nucleolar RNA-associated protein 17)